MNWYENFEKRNSRVTHLSACLSYRSYEQRMRYQWPHLCLVVYRMMSFQLDYEQKTKLAMNYYSLNEFESVFSNKKLIGIDCSSAWSPKVKNAAVFFWFARHSLSIDRYSTSQTTNIGLVIFKKYSLSFLVQHVGIDVIGHPKHSAANNNGTIWSVLLVKKKISWPFLKPRFWRFFITQTVNAWRSPNVLVLPVIAQIYTKKQTHTLNEKENHEISLNFHLSNFRIVHLERIQNHFPQRRFAIKIRVGFNAIPLLFFCIKCCSEHIQRIK